MSTPETPISPISERRNSFRDLSKENDVEDRDSKRKHKKSRGGCGRCKERRVKCDEKKPCGNCQRRKEDCDLLLPDSSRARLKCPSCQGQETPMEWARDAYLMHHYSTETALSIMQNEEINRLFQFQVPEFALREPHLMRGLMSLSAFHLAYKRPAETTTWLQLASKHHAAITRSLQYLINNVNTENCIPTFCLSILVAITSLASSNWAQTPGSDAAPNILEQIQPLMFIRGTTTIFQYTQELQSIFQGGPLTAFIEGYHIITDTSEFLPETARNQFAFIRELFHRKLEKGNFQTAMEFSLNWLEKIYSEVACTGGTANGNTCMVWKWLAPLTDTYFEALKGLNEASILIFAYFALLSKVYRGYWYLQGWPERVIKAASITIQDDEYKTALEWATSQLQVDLDIFNRDSTTSSTLREIV